MILVIVKNTTFHSYNIYLPPKCRIYTKVQDYNITILTNHEITNRVSGHLNETNGLFERSKQVV